MEVINGQRKAYLLFLLELMFVTLTTQRNLTIKRNADYDSFFSVDSRIVGGVKSGLHDWPWMAAIFEKKHSYDKIAFACGGAVISHKNILTAAHCFFYGIIRIPNENIALRLGDHDLKSNLTHANPADYNVREIFIHDNFTPVITPHFNDIAIVKIKGFMTYGDDIQPVFLPTREMRTNTFESTQPIISGWGSQFFHGPPTRLLRHVQLDVFSNEICKQIYAHRLAIISSQLCAGALEGGKDACQGDSGGPLVIHVKQKWYVIGVVSVGHKCAEPGFLGIFTRVTSFIGWIETIIDE